MSPPPGRVRRGARTVLSAVHPATELAEVLARCVRRYGVSAPRAASRLRLLGQRGFRPREAWELGLLDPEVPRASLHDYVSKRAIMRAQRALNPAAWSRFAQDKGMFYRHCGAVGIPVPRLLALFFRDGPGWTPGGRAPCGGKEWEEWFLRELPEEFVVKPCLGYHGLGVRLFRRAGRELVDGEGRACTAAGLHEALRSAEFDAFVIQERLRNHADLARLGGTDHLQTVRIMTLVGGDGSIEILQALFKPIVEPNTTDNYRGGRSGNLLARVRAEDGVLGPAVIAPPNGSGVRLLESHPSTGIAFRGFRLPRWDETLRSVESAARAFLPLRTVGWDVAITPDGAAVVEGNVWWDPPNPLGGMAEVEAALLRAAVVGRSPRPDPPARPGEARRAGKARGSGEPAVP